METIASLVRYLAFVVNYGDYLNDWLTHLPEMYQPMIQGIGHVIAVIVHWL